MDPPGDAYGGYQRGAQYQGTTSTNTPAVYVNGPIVTSWDNTEPLTTPAPTNYILNTIQNDFMQQNHGRMPENATANLNQRAQFLADVAGMIQNPHGNMAGVGALITMPPIFQQPTSPLRAFEDSPDFRPGLQTAFNAVYDEHIRLAGAQPHSGVPPPPMFVQGSSSSSSGLQPPIQPVQANPYLRGNNSQGQEPPRKRQRTNSNPEIPTDRVGTLGLITDDFYIVQFGAARTAAIELAVILEGQVPRSNLGLEHDKKAPTFNSLRTGVFHNLSERIGEKLVMYFDHETDTRFSRDEVFCLSHSNPASFGYKPMLESHRKKDCIDGLILERLEQNGYVWKSKGLAEMAEKLVDKPLAKQFAKYRQSFGFGSSVNDLLCKINTRHNTYNPFFITGHLAREVLIRFIERLGFEEECIIDLEDPDNPDVASVITATMALSEAAVHVQGLNRSLPRDIIVDGQTKGLTWWCTLLFDEAEACYRFLVKLQKISPEEKSWIMSWWATIRNEIIQRNQISIDEKPELKDQFKRYEKGLLQIMGHMSERTSNRWAKVAKWIEETRRKTAESKGTGSTPLVTIAGKVK